MKFEKINDNQIRCTLTQQDLANRHLKLSELAYGTEKAKMLFHDMMQQANYELGFEIGDIPLMIEAIPISSESIILLITKVEYPEELDTRFSKFSDMPEDFDDFSDQDTTDVFSEGADDILGLFKKISEENKAHSHKSDSIESPIQQESSVDILPKGEIGVPIDLTKMFIFRSFSDIIRISHILKDFYEGDNSLFKDESNGIYYLILHKSSLSPEVFNKVCNIMAEYANQGVVTSSTESFFAEHHKIICAHNSLQTFAML